MIYWQIFLDTCLNSRLFCGLGLEGAGSCLAVEQGLRIWRRQRTNRTASRDLTTLYFCCLGWCSDREVGHPCGNGWYVFMWVVRGWGDLSMYQHCVFCWEKNTLKPSYDMNIHQFWCKKTPLFFSSICTCVIGLPGSSQLHWATRVTQK